MPHDRRRRSRRVSLWPASALTFLSGAANLLSVTPLRLPQDAQLLRDLFLVPSARFSHFATLLSGFALIVAAGGVLQAKRRVFWPVFTLALFSGLIHLWRGIDVPAALLSLALGALLLWTRPAFTVHSRQISGHQALRGVLLVAGVALVYATFGFWLLNKREFGVNFRLPEALREAGRSIFLLNRDTLLPQTRFARWFLDSITLLTAFAVIAGLLTALQPVAFRLLLRPAEQARAARLVAEFGRTSLDFFKTWPDKNLFFSHSGRAFCAYGVSGAFALVLGDPVGPAEEIPAIIAEFRAYCRDNGWRLAFHQVSDAWLAAYAAAGFKKIKVGEEALVDVPQFTLAGHARKSLRNGVSHLEREGITTRYFPPPVADEVLAMAQAVSNAWLTLPGRSEHGFTLGWFESDYLRHTALLAAFLPSGEMVAFANILPDYAPQETTIDLMRHTPGAPSGMMDFLFVRLIETYKAAGYTRLNLGLAPLANHTPQTEPTRQEEALKSVIGRLNQSFSYDGLTQFKAKFATIWTPVYTCFQTDLDLPRLGLALSRLTELHPERRRLFGRAPAPGAAVDGVAGAVDREQQA